MGDRNIVSNLPFLLKHSLTKESIEDMSQHVALASQCHFQRLKFMHIEYYPYREGVCGKGTRVVASIAV